MIYNILKEGVNVYYLLAIITACAGGSTTILKKNYVNNTKNIERSNDIYLLVNITVATLYFYFLSGGNVPLNLSTLIFSVVYALIGLFSVIVGLVSYNYAAVAYITVISGALGTIIPFLYELLFTDVIFSTSKIISVFFRIMAISVILLLNKKEKVTKMGVLLCIVLGLISGAAGVTTRMYATFPGVESDGSFFFWTNVFTLPMIFISCFKKGTVKKLAEDFRKIKKLNYVYALGSMFINNAITFVSIDIIRNISGTVYGIISGSLQLIMATVISLFVYRERLSVKTLISVGLSIIAVVLSLL